MIAAACSGPSWFRSSVKPIQMVEVENQDFSTSFSQHDKQKSRRELGVKESTPKAAEAPPSSNFGVMPPSAMLEPS
jgi:hypothetical protein